MGAPALPRCPLLLLLLTGMFGQRWGTLAQVQVCSVAQNFFEVEENSDISAPLVEIQVPADQQVSLGPSSTPSAFRIENNQLFLNVSPDYEVVQMLEAQVECKRGTTVVTQLRVFVAVEDVNDNIPEFPFTTKEHDVEEDTKVGTVVIPEADLQATDRDKDDVLFYTLQEVTPNASSFFSLVGANRPALRLDRTLDFYKSQNMTFQLLVRDTWDEQTNLNHTATATLVLKVLPADLRPPWFLPCSYQDGYVCVQAQYSAVIPVGHMLPSPLILSPGPIHAVDGDAAINQRIIYSILSGNTNDVFSINANTGNLTMTKSVRSPTTFLLLVRGDQADMARYSVTQVTIEARDATGNSPQFSQSLYRGTVALGSAAGTPVKDAASPTQPLRIWAQNPQFPDLNSNITYQITNCSEFRMDGETVLTTAALEHTAVFYAEVEANNTVTMGIATAVVEIQVVRQESSEEPPTSPETGGTAGPSSSSTPEAPTPSGTSQQPTTTSSGGGSGSSPPSGTTLRPSSTASSIPTTPQSVTPSGGSTETPKPEMSQPTAPTTGASTPPQSVTPDGGSTQTPSTEPQPMAPSAGTGTSPKPATPSGGSTQTPEPGASQPTATGPSRSPPAEGIPGPGDGRFSTVDMAVLGAVLGALLLLALICLAILIHKHYGHRFTCCSGKASKSQPSSFDNKTFIPEDKASWTPPASLKRELSSTLPEPPHVSPRPSPPSPPSPVPTVPAPPSPELLSRASAPESPPTTRAVDSSPSAVRSILTKERRLEGGYKAVWFGEDIGAEADVVVLNTPSADMDGTGDSGSEGSGEEDAGQDEVSRHDADSTFI